MTISSRGENTPKTVGISPLTVLNDVESTISDAAVLVPRQGKDPVSVSPRGVFRMAAAGFTLKDIATFHGINPRAIRENFTEALNLGRAHIKSSIRAHLVKVAMSDKAHPSVLIFAAKSYGGLSESGQDDDGEGITTDTTININVMEKPND